MNDFRSIASIELAHLNYPPSPWVVPRLNACDVAIIGGGMAGLTAAFALYRQGIFNIQIFDETDKGSEGPWATYARMPILRSGKDLVGPAMDLRSF